MPAFLRVRCVASPVAHRGSQGTRCQAKVRPGALWCRGVAAAEPVVAHVGPRSACRATADLGGSGGHARKGHTWPLGVLRSDSSSDSSRCSCRGRRRPCPPRRFAQGHMTHKVGSIPWGLACCLARRVVRRATRKPQFRNKNSKVTETPGASATVDVDAAGRHAAGDA